MVPYERVVLFGILPPFPLYLGESTACKFFLDQEKFQKFLLLLQIFNHLLLDEDCLTFIHRIPQAFAFFTLKLVSGQKKCSFPRLLFLGLSFGSSISRNGCTQMSGRVGGFIQKLQSFPRKILMVKCLIYESLRVFFKGN